MFSFSRFSRKPRIAAIGCIVFVQLAIFSILIWLLGVESKSPPRPSHLDRTVLSRDDGQTGGPIVSIAGDGWLLVEQFSAHHALILKVETERLWATKSITQELIEPVISSYNEVLVYFYLTTEKNSLPVRRVQWTKEGGYVEMDLRE